MSVPYELILQEDLNIGYGTATVTAPAGGTMTGHKIGIHSFGVGFAATDFGVLADGASDDTVALNAAYAAAKAASATLYLNWAGTALISSQLVWDGSVDVHGFGTNVTFLKKTGDFVGIRFYGTDQRWDGFTLTSVGTAGGDSSDGFNFDDVSHSVVNLTVQNQGGNGAVMRGGILTNFELLLSISNTGHGLVWDSQSGSDGAAANACVGNISAHNNGGHGLWFKKGDQNNLHYVLSQNNTGKGVLIGGDTPSGSPVANKFGLYLEGNTDTDLVVSSDATRTNLIIQQITGPSDFIDSGVNTFYTDMSGSVVTFSPTFGPVAQQTNSDGTILYLLGGTAGAGATGKSGGAVNILGGDAAGTTGDASGGGVTIAGGAKVNSGSIGSVTLQNNAGALKCGGSSTTLGFYGVTPIARAVLATGASHTVDDVITALQNLGLVKQS